VVRVLAAVAILISPGLAGAGVLGVGDRAPELDSAVDATGKPFHLAAYRGRWLVIAVGAAWCVPCRAELPVWDRLAGQLAGRVVFVALDIDDDIDDGKQLHAELKLARMVRAYLPQDRSAIADRYGAQKMPMTFVVDPGGIIRDAHEGFDTSAAKAEERRMAATLATLVPAPKPPKPAPPKPAPPEPTPPKPTPPKPAPPEPGPAPVSTVSWQVVAAPPHASWWSDRWIELAL